MSTLPLILLALIPPTVDLTIPLVDSVYCVWYFLLSAFLGLFFWHTSAPLGAKLLLACALVNCFFSAAPWLSFGLYGLVVACAYYYLWCTRISNWHLTANVITTLLGLNGLLLVMQWVHKDTLLNFGLAGNTCHGAVGNAMQLKSFVFLSTAFLIAYYKPAWLRRFAVETTTILIFLGIAYYFCGGEYMNFPYTRGPAWAQAWALAAQHPWTGWGIGMFKVLFPVLGKGVFQGAGVWYTAHNDFLQVLFEMGWPGFVLMAAFGVSLFIRVKDFYCRFALVLAAGVLFFHFPMRQTQCVPLLILLLAYCQSVVKKV